MTRDRDTLISLAERVEALTGPCREVDGEIDRFFHKRPKDGDYCPSERAIWRVTDGWSGLLVRGDGFARGSFCARDYTASLDAAMSLADGLDWCGGAPGLLREAMDRLLGRWERGGPVPYREALARFFTAASLRARAAMMTEEG